MFVIAKSLFALDNTLPFSASWDVYSFLFKKARLLCIFLLCLDRLTKPRGWKNEDYVSFGVVSARKKCKNKQQLGPRIRRKCPRRKEISYSQRLQVSSMGTRKLKCRRSYRKDHSGK